MMGCAALHPSYCYFAVFNIQQGDAPLLIATPENQNIRHDFQGASSPGIKHNATALRTLYGKYIYHCVSRGYKFMADDLISNFIGAFQ